MEVVPPVTKLLPSLRPFFGYLSPSPVAPVVTRRTSQLTGGRWHATSGVLASVPMFGGLPPHLCVWRYLARVWVEGRSRRPGCSWGSQCAVAILDGVSLALLTPCDRLGVCLCPTPPPPTPPFPVQPYLSRYPPYQWDSIFVIAPLALSPSVPPGPGPVDLLNAVRTLFHVHPPYSVAMFVVRSHPNT